METRIPIDASSDTHFAGSFALETEYSTSSQNISWSAILAGFITAVAISICFSFLVAALGLGKIDLSFSAPFEGALTSMGIGSIATIILSLAGGGFVAGRFAKGAGAAHGFLTWALLTLAVTLQAALFLSGAANLGAQTVSGAASSLKTGGQAILSATNSQSLERLLDDQVSPVADFDKLRGDLRTLLNKNEISALDPERLNQAYEGALGDIRSALTAFKDDPSHYRTYLRDLGSNLSERAQTLKASINRNDIVRTLVNDGMTQAEAEQTADRAIRTYQAAREKIEQAIETLSEQTGHIETLAQNAQTAANKAIGTASAIGWLSFLGSLIGAITASICGYYGYQSRQNYFIF
ncbi:putative membrane protein [Bartonella australis AUST/NH1]|uniref:Putative membrane protein n=1 Tax=Bartonella australis (strain Aust/NH1) TaxID=1094489 RepID=M1PE29_BARAA|nr:hypothetical protein [Bartonella australis]AGF74866.1 putative membrane protein [Bartonella australis AUST/NH1]